MVMGLIGLLMAANFSSNALIVMIGLSMATMGALAALAQFWSLPVAFLGARCRSGRPGAD
jgi:hypothetical protein